MIKSKKKKALIACTAFAGALSIIAASFAFSVKSVRAEETSTVKYIATEYGTDWEGKYGADGYVIIGENKGSYYTDMQQDNDGKTLITDSSWTLNSTALTSFSPKSDSLAESLSYGTVVWQANSSAQTYNLCAPGSADKLKTRAHQNANKQYFADVYAGFKLTSDETTYVTVNVSDYSKKVSGVNPITVSVYKSDKTTTNIQAYPSNSHPEWYKTMDAFYGDALASTTVNQQSANVTFKLTMAGDYRIVAYYDNASVVDEDGNMISTGTVSPVTPQINGWFFDNEDPTTAKINDVSLTLDGMIGLNFYTRIPGVFENAKMKFEYSDGTTEYVEMPAAESDGTYKFTAKFAAKDYANGVTATLYDGETAISESKTYSVKDYCDYVIKNQATYGEKLVVLCRSLENYGSQASAYFSAESDASEVTLNAADLESYKAKAEGTLPVSVKGIALKLEAGTNLRIYVAKTEGVTATVDGKELSAGSDANGVYFEIANISSTELSKAFAVKISDETQEGVVTVSSYSYGYTVISQYRNGNDQLKQLALVVEKLYNYGIAAEAYFA